VAGGGEVSRRTLIAQVNMWVIYSRPLDYPDHYVVRRWRDNVPDQLCQLAETLDEARQYVPDGLVQIPAADGDDPCIAEVWL
jgi:hypothetical protein